MKNSFGLLLIFFLGSGILQAQNQPEFLPVPPGLTEISIAESVFIGTDSTGRKGVIGKNGKWLNDRRFSELLGPVAGTFFGISNLAKTEDKSWNIADLDRCPWITASQSEPSGSHFFIFRMDTCGEILDSFQLSGIEISLEKAGIICRLGFPEAQTYFLPANGKPVLMLKKWMEKKTKLDGIQNKLSLACQFVTDEDSIWSSAFPDARDRLLHSRRPGFPSETDPEFIRKHIPGFTFYYFNPNSTGPVIVYENKIGPRYWMGMKIVEIPYNETALWIRNQNGITCFKANEVSRPHQQIFKAIVTDSEMNPYPVIYSGHSGDYLLESESPLKRGVLPERTHFLFSYPVVSNYNLEEEKNKKPSSPEKSMFWKVMSAFQNDLIENRNLDPDSRIALSLERPSMVFEKAGKLFALDPKGRAIALPAVKDTIVFLSRLRFMHTDSENDYFPVWNDLFETTKTIKQRLQASIQAFDHSPKLFLVPSQSIPAKFRASTNARSLLYLCDGSLYAENGNRLPISGKIVSLIGTWDNRLLVRTVHNQKMEIRDAGNKVLYTGVESSISVTEEGSILVNRDDLTFLLIPKNGSLQKGKILTNVIPLMEHYYGEQDREQPKSRNSVMPYKGAYANLVHPLFTTRPEENFFLAGKAEDEEGNVFYQQLRNGLDQIVLKSPLRITYPSGIIRVEGKSGSRTVPIPCMKPIDSIAADGQKRAWMYEDENGFYFRINGKNKRLDIQKVYVSMGGKKVFYQINTIWFSLAMNGNITKLDLPPVSDLFFDAISWPRNVIRMMAGPVCVPPGEKSKDIFTLPMVFNPVTGTRTELQPHPSVKFVYRIPDSLCFDRRQKWLIFPEFISTKAGEFLKKYKPVYHAGYDKILGMDEEALSVIASGNQKDLMDLSKLLNGISWLNIHLQADTIEKGVPVMSLPNSSYNNFYIKLLRNKTGISVVADKNETLNIRYEQLYTDQLSDCYAIKRENGLFELFDHVGTLGQFKKIAASCRISERISVILAEKPDGEIVGFYPSDDQQVRFKPPGYLQKIFPHLPSLKACTYTGLLAEEPYLTVLPEIYGTSLPFGYSNEEGACNDCSILLKSIGITGKLFNPFKIPDPHILNTLKRKILYTGLNTLEIQANGNYINRSISFPPGYRCNLQNIGLSQSRKGGYSLFIPMDSLNQGAGMNKRWFFEAFSEKIFPMEGASFPSLLIPENIVSGDYSEINAQDYYLSIGDKPVLLSSISYDISGFRDEGGQLVATMNPWTGFIDKTGRQKISISCEGGSCSGEVVQFKSGFAALRKDSRVLYIDTTGKNPFGLSFACASDFVGNYAIVVDPQPLENMNTKEEEPLDVLEMSVNTHLPDSPPESEKEEEEEEDATTMIQWLHRSGKLIKPDLRKVGRNGVEFNINSLHHNGEFTLISKGGNIIILDTSGACRELEEKYRRYVETMFDRIRNPKLPEISEGLFRVRNASGTGFCNTEGKLIIPCRFFEASTFSCGISAVIGKGDKYLSRPFYIDRNGKELFTHLTFSEINPFSEGIARATLENEKSILLDSTGKILAEDDVPQKIRFKNKMALATLSLKDNVVKRIYEKKGYINRSGVMVIPPKYEQASDFSEGIAVVKEKEGGSYFIDQTGKRMPNLPEVSKAGSFSEGLCHIFLPEIQIGFDMNTGTFQALKPTSDPEGFEWMRANGFSMEQKSPSYSIWKKSNYISQEFKVLKH